MTVTAYLVLHGDNTKVFHRSFEGNIATPDVCRIAVYPAEARWSANSNYLCFVNVQHELIAVHPWYKTSSIHVWMPACTEQNSLDGALCESSESSAYLWKSQPWAEITSDRGWEYNTNKTGQRTEPWGTPYTRFVSQLVGALSQVNHKGLHQGWTQTIFYLKVIHFTNHHTTSHVFLSHEDLPTGGRPILFCGPTQEPCVNHSQHAKKSGEVLEEMHMNGVEG